MRGYLSIDYAISALLMMSLVAATLIRFSPSFHSFHQSFRFSYGKLQESANHGKAIIELTIDPIHKASFAYMIPRRYVDLWYTICTWRNTTLTCTSPNNCRYNDSNEEIRVIYHGTGNASRWCKDQYYNLQIGDRVYTIYRINRRG
jgi:hypothetical protein